ncbi:MAG: hypothetical protein ABSH20_23060 [Tepidisphaeraceae bacterium]|jgi:hypothetical protein
MSDTLPGNLLHKLRHTPMRDLVRGRCTGRLDVKGRIVPARTREGVGEPRRSPHASLGARKGRSRR